MGLPKGFLRLPAPGSLVKPAALPRRLAPSHAARHLHPSTAGRSTTTSTPISALRQLARRLFSTTPARPSRAPTPPAPADLATRVRLHARPTWHTAAQQARRFGPGGLGRGPMGPGLRSGFAAGKSVVSVGLGPARGYASTAQPLFSNLVSNAPLLLRAGVDELKDQVADLKKQRRTRPAHAAKADKGRKRSSASKSLQQASSIRGPAAAAAVVDAVVSEEADFHAFFGPSPAHAIPPARSPWATTTLSIPLAPPLHETAPSTSLSHLAALHREAYDAHRTRLDGLLHALEQQGAWLDDGVRVLADDDEVRIVFAGRAADEVRLIVGGKTKREDDWFVLRETRKGDRAADDRSHESLVFPLLSASVVLPVAAAAVSASSSDGSPSPASSSSSGLTTPSTDLAFSVTDDDGRSASSAGFSSAFLSDLSVSSAGRQGFDLVDLSDADGFDEDWSDA